MSIVYGNGAIMCQQLKYNLLHFATVVNSYCVFISFSKNRLRGISIICTKLSKCFHVFQDWAIKYDQDQPVAPRYEINAPDLYIPGNNIRIKHSFRCINICQALV